MNDDATGNLTFYSRRGCSTIDYAAVNKNLLDNILNFQVSDITEFSDHAYLTLNIASHASTKNDPVMSQGEKANNSSTAYYRWKSELSHIIKNKLKAEIGHISEIVESTACNVESIDDCVCKLTDIINDITSVCKYCKTSKRVKTYRDKPWFDDKCRELYRNYKDSLDQFNKCKSTVNRINLTNSEKLYKSHCLRTKRKYMRSEGNKLDYARKGNPKGFFEMFK